MEDEQMWLPVGSVVTLKGGEKPVMVAGFLVRDAQTEELRCEGESKHCFMGQDGRPVSLRRSWPALDRTFTDQLTPEPTENASC